MKIYMAGPLFTMAERTANAALAAELRSLGHEVFLPQEHNDEESAREVFDRNEEALATCDIVFANLDGPDVDSGTAWEIGYAYGLVPSIGYRSDLRDAGDHRDVSVNLMIHQAVFTIVSADEPRLLAEALVKTAEEVLR